MPIPEKPLQESASKSKPQGRSQKIVAKKKTIAQPNDILSGPAKRAHKDNEKYDRVQEPDTRELTITTRSRIRVECNHDP